MENIMDLSSLAFRGEALDRLSAQLHESRAATKRGLDNAVPVALAGLAEETRSTNRAEQLLSVIRSGDYPHVRSGEVASALANPVETEQVVQSGTSFLERFFGSRLMGLVDAVARASGLSRTSATTLLGLAMPVVLEEVGTETRTRALDADGLSRMLAREELKVSRFLPPTFPSARTEARMPAERKRGIGWGVAALAALVALVLFFFALRANRSPLSAPNIDARPTETPEQNIGLPGEDVPGLRPGGNPAITPVPGSPRSAGTVPEGTRGTASESPVATGTSPSPQTANAEATPLHTSDAFAAYLGGDDPTPRSFVLTGIEYGADDDQIARHEVLDGVIAALKEHPTAKVRVEGHSGAIGTDAEKQLLSESRALAVRNYLVRHGIEGQRVEAVGRSADRPLAPNDTARGRAQNERVELVVTER
jgi:OmpA-OmpF porin, OOP family